tara:strand:+ start:762 stop:1004 length:243 start_codon:yes stop_codon:yes gene_type:complete
VWLTDSGEEDVNLSWFISIVKARHDWYQTSTHVFLEIFIKKITKEQCEIDVTEKSVNVSVKITEHQYYEVRIHYLFIYII